MLNPFSITSLLLTLCSLHSIIIIIRAGKTPSRAHPHTWCYDEEDCAPPKWKGSCTSGTLQSPINIDLSSKRRRIILEKVRLHVDNLEADKFFLNNNGHTLNIDFTPPSSFFPGGRKGLLKHPYKLGSVHFHWGAHDDVGSEHQIDGQTFSMEMHLVHYKSEFQTFKDAVASGDPDALAVIGIFFQADPKTGPSSSLAPIIKNLNLVKTANSSTWFKVDARIDIDELVPTDSPKLKIVHYSGSLTTPPCSEEVEWFVFTEPVRIASSDVAAFRGLRDEEGKRILNNHRPILPEGERSRRHWQIKVIDGVYKEGNQRTGKPWKGGGGNRRIIMGSNDDVNDYEDENIPQKTIPAKSRIQGIKGKW